MSEQNMPEHEISEFSAQIIKDRKEFGEFEDKVLKVIGRGVGRRDSLQFCIGENMLDVFARLDVSPQGISPVLEWKKSYGIIPDTKKTDLSVKDYIIQDVETLESHELTKLYKFIQRALITKTGTKSAIPRLDDIDVKKLIYILDLYMDGDVDDRTDVISLKEKLLKMQGL